MSVTAALAASPAAAQDALPSLFDVTGVATDDLLNVRAGPSADADAVGTLPPDARAIEVVARDAGRNWGQINLGEGAGWVSLRYLSAQEGVWAPGALPATLRCFGTEPFWSVAPQDETLILSTPEGDTGYSHVSVLDQDFAPERRRIALATGDAGRLTLVISPAACSDGMSDRAFGLRADTVLEDADGPELRTGCCSVAP